jgi:hypothetical protein
MNAFTIYSLFATPFMYVLSIQFETIDPLYSFFRLVFPEYYPEVRSIELINDIFFMIDIVLSFFKINGDNRVLSKTAWHYLS